MTEVEAIYTALKAVAHDMKAEYLRNRAPAANVPADRAEYRKGIAWACDMYCWRIESAVRRLGKLMEEENEGN